MQQQNSVAQKIETFKAFNPFEFQENHQQANHFSKLNNFENFEVFKNTKLSNATAMQQRIWHFLLHVNDLHCYESLAHLIGGKSCRAVGTGVGKNPFAYLGRCHLILPKQDLIN
jgi:O6-methylguanine-DNA--protein-cysteine methyltransferase